MKTLSIVLLLFLVGCANNLDRNDPSVVATNKANLSSGGETVGTLPDGRKVIRYSIHTGTT